MRKASWISSPTVRRRRLPKCSYSSSRSAIGSRGIEMASSAKSLIGSSPSGPPSYMPDSGMPSSRGSEISSLISSMMSRGVSVRVSSDSSRCRRLFSL